MADTSLVFNIIGKDKASATVENVARRVRAASILAAAGQMALGAGFASAAAHAISLAAAIAPVISLLGMIPSASLAGVSLIAGLGLGFSGMGKALTAVNAGGGGATRTLGNIAGAERRVAQAQREAKQAQEKLNEARRTAAERIAGYSREIRRAQLDEEGATNALADARKRFEEASMATGPQAADQYRDAELAVRQAEMALEDAKKRTEELQQEQAESNREGVEGSDEVRDARQRQADAVQTVADAQEALKQAQAGTSSGGAGGINAQADAMARLAPNARAVVRTILDLLPAWRRVQQAVQNRMWEGVAGDLRRLSAAYLPTVRDRMVEFAGGVNLAVREFAGLVSSRGYVQDVDATLANTNTFTTQLARALVPVLSGFRQWGLIGSSFLPQFGAWLLAGAQRFERWSAAARQSGAMKRWMSEGITALNALWQIGGNVVGIISAILRPNASNGRDLLATLTQLTARAKAFLNSAEGQARIATVFTALRSILTSVAALVPTVAAAVTNFATSAASADGATSPLADTLNVTGTVMGFLAQHAGTLGELLPYLAGGFLVFKATQAAGNVATAASIPLTMAKIASELRLSVALRAHTAALQANTVATRSGTAAGATDTATQNAGLLARTRAIAVLGAQKAAQLAMNIATKIGTAANWLMAASTWAALGPVLLVIAAIALLAVGIYFLWTRCETFRKIVTRAFEIVWGAIKVGWQWVRKNWPLLLAMLTGPIGLAVLAITKNWGRITSMFARFRAGLSGLWSGLKSGFRSALNWVIARWNNFSIGLPGFSFAGMSVPGIRIDTPNIPYLAAGGTATAGGFVTVGERGPERLWMPAGATVEPLRAGRGPSAAGGVSEVRLVIDVRGGDSELKRLIRRWIRTDNLLQGA